MSINIQQRFKADGVYCIVLLTVPYTPILKLSADSGNIHRAMTSLVYNITNEKI